MCSLGFDHYIEPLSLYLNKYRETTKSDRNLVRDDVRGNTETSTNTNTTTTTTVYENQQPATDFS